MQVVRAQLCKQMAGLSAKVSSIGVPRTPVSVPFNLRQPSARLMATGNSVKGDVSVVKQADEYIDFRPFDEVKEELTAVEQAQMDSPEIKDSFARVYFDQECEMAINEQINIEYNMSYVYHAMSSYFNRDNVSLPGFAAFCQASSLEERSHAQQLMDYQATRGGRVKLAHITSPLSQYSHEEKGDALHAMELALSLEKLNFQKLRDLHDVAEKAEDAQMQDFVEDMLAEQVEGVKEIADYVAQLRRLGKGHGVWDFDRRVMAPRALTMFNEAAARLHPTPNATMNLGSAAAE